MNPLRRLRVMSPEFRRAWLAYQRANAAAADMYEALPVAFNSYGPIHRCPCGTQTANARCRWCRRKDTP